MGTYEDYKYTKNTWSSSECNPFSDLSIPTPYTKELVSKTQYDLLLFQVAELRRRVEEVEERELVLIRKLMESLDGADDKTST